MCEAGDMPMRNALYLDLELVQNVADYFGVELQVETKFVETGGSKSGVGVGLGFESIAKASYDRGKTSEVQASYEVPVRPLRALNDVIDAVEAQGEVAFDFNETPLDGLVRGDLVRFDGLLSVSPATEVGALLSVMLPLFGSSSSGQFTPELQAQMLGALMNPPTASGPQLFTTTAGGQESTFLVSVDPAYLFRNSTFEDLASDVTVFGSVEAIVPAGQNISLERWLLPDVNPAMRRLLMEKGLGEMLKGLKTSGLNVDAAEVVAGPALQVRPMAIY